jgi:hypothetical protein
MIGPWKVVSRRRRFGPKSRELYKELNQTQKELKDEKESKTHPPADSPISEIQQKPSNFDELA